MRSVAECYVLLFFAMAMLGWLMEVVCKLIQFHRFINRGFLIGPYCPIYGFGSVLIVLLLERYAEHPAVVFFMGMLVCGTLEYVTSYGMERLFHARWWDYSGRRFNLNGRICAGTLIPFGLLGLLLVYVLKPGLFSLFGRLPQGWLDGLSVGLTLLLLADTVVSSTVLSKIRKSAELSGADDTETITHEVRVTLSRQGALIRRALRAFPDARIYNKSLIEQLKRRRQALREEAQARKLRMRAHAVQLDGKIRAEVGRMKNLAQKHQR